MQLSYFPTLVLNSATTSRPVFAWSSGAPVRTPSAEFRDPTPRNPRSAQPQSIAGLIPPVPNPRVCGVIPGMPNPGVFLECPPQYPWSTQPKSVEGVPNPRVSLEGGDVRSKLMMLFFFIVFLLLLLLRVLWFVCLILL